jgi:hypothetical protein
MVYSVLVVVGLVGVTQTYVLQEVEDVPALVQDVLSD